MAQLALLNTYGDVGLLRTHEPLKAAIADAFMSMKHVNQNEGVQDVQDQHHFSYQLADLLSTVQSYDLRPDIGQPKGPTRTGLALCYAQFTDERLS